MADKYEGVTEPDGTVCPVEALDDAPRPFKAFLDVGLKRTSTGSKVFAVMKGASDGGIFIPHSENRFPGYDAEQKKLDPEILRKYIYGGHVADYMRLLQEEDDDKFKRQFSKFIEAGVSADDLEDIYKQAHMKIRENPEFTPTTKKGDYKVFKKVSEVICLMRVHKLLLLNKSISFFFCSFPQFKKQGLNLKQRRDKVKQKIDSFKRAQSKEDE